MKPTFRHDFPFGAQLVSENRCRFRLWAPGSDQVALHLEGRMPLPMEREKDNGYFVCECDAAAGTAYQFAVKHNDEEMLVPDPASRMQQDDVHGPSLVVDPAAYQWRNPEWRGRPWQEMIIYEVHPGCWGGFQGIRQQLRYLAELGIGAIELMPIADFSGTRNWGYDGVLLYAPDRAYGSPEDLKQLIDEAHGLGLCVYLDVVYNHFGPDGNYLHVYAPDFFSPDKSSPWGTQIDFSRTAVRDFFTHNALYWLQEYRFDGLRFDAVHAIPDPSWLDEMAATVRQTFGAERQVHLMAENERNRSEHLERDFDAQWNDDIHNVLHVMLTGEHEGYYSNFVDAPAQKLARGLGSGFVYQGEASPRHNNEPRGSASGHLPPHAFVMFLQNHDQVGNRACGERLIHLCDPQALRAATVLLLLSPQIPLLFMDEERGADTPFLFFTDFHGELADAVRNGRRKEFSAFSAFASEDAQKSIPDPNALNTFELSASFKRQDTPEQLRFYEFYRELIKLRRERIIPLLSQAQHLHAEAIGESAVLASWRLGAHTLSIALNLSEQAVDAPVLTKHCSGELLYESREEAGTWARTGRLPEYSCAVFL